MRADWNGLYDAAPLPAGGTRWRLPVRATLGRAVGSALFLVIFGLLFGGVPLGAVIAGGVASKGWGLLALPIAAPFTLIGFACVFFGVALAFGRSEVQIRDGAIVAVERLGPLAFPRRRPVAEVVSFEVEGGAIRTNGKALRAAQGGEFSTLRARLRDDSKKPFPLAGMYPRETLLALARELADACDAHAPAELLGDGPAPVVEVDWRAQDRPATHPVERPANTPITLDHAEGVTTIRIPPAGAAGSRGLLAFGVLWLAFTTLVCGGVLWKVITSPGSIQGSPWVMAIILPLFLAVGAAMTGYALSLARRRTVIDIVGDTLLITRSGLKRVRSWEWRAADLERIHVGPSGMEINDQPVLALLIEPREGRKTILLAERSADELRWIAWELEQAVGLGATQGARAA